MSLQTRTPLKAKTSLRAKKPLKAKACLKQKQPWQRKKPTTDKRRRTARRSRKTEFSAKERKRIYSRDRGCIFCRLGYAPGTAEDAYGRSILETMHYLPRSQGGLGIAENAALGCKYHHMMLDNGSGGRRQEMRALMAEYLRSCYPDWQEDKLYYAKDGQIGQTTCWQGKMERS